MRLKPKTKQLAKSFNEAICSEVKSMIISSKFKKKNLLKIQL